MKSGERIRLNAKCAWPERRGCTGVIVAPPADGRYPQPARSEVIVLLDDDPLDHWPWGHERGWSCVIDRRSVEVLRDV